KSRDVEGLGAGRVEDFLVVLLDRTERRLDIVDFGPCDERGSGRSASDVELHPEGRYADRAPRQTFLTLPGASALAREEERDQAVPEGEAMADRIEDVQVRCRHAPLDNAVDDDANARDVGFDRRLVGVVLVPPVDREVAPAGGQ